MLLPLLPVPSDAFPSAALLDILAVAPAVVSVSASYVTRSGCTVKPSAKAA